MSKIAVIGLVGESVFLKVDRHQVVGETAHAERIHREWGGKGYNQAVAAARFGAEVSFLGAVSVDDVERVKAHAEEMGITPCLIPKDSPTAFGVIITDSTGDNRVTVYKGAELDEYDLDGFYPHIASCDILLLNNEVPEEVNIAAARIADDFGKRVILNPAPAREISDYILSVAELVTPNEHELSAVSECERVLVTLGGEGCHIKWLDARVPAVTVGEPVDTTGAGDTFNGVLAAALAEGEDIVTATTLANVAAGIEVTHRFVMPAIPSREEIFTTYNSYI